MAETHGLLTIRGLIPELEYIIHGRRTTEESLVEILEAAHDRGVALDWETLNDIFHLVDGKYGIHAPIVPAQVVELLSAYLQAKPGMVAFDPWAGSGILMTALAEVSGLASGIGIVDSPGSERLAKLISRGLPLSWMTDSLPAAMTDFQRSVDVIVSIPPLNKSRRDVQIIVDEGTRPGRRRVSLIAGVLTDSLEMLAETGTIVIVVPDSFLDPEGEDRRVLAERGLFVNAVIALPSRLFSGVSMQQSLVVMSRKQTAKVFAGHLTLGVDPGPLMANLHKRKAGLLPELGVLVDAATFQSWTSVVAAQQIERLARKSGGQAVPFERAVQHLAPAKRADADVADSSVSIYLPMMKTGPAITRLDDDSDPARYLQLVVNQDLATPDYLTHFYNSPLGTAVLESAYSGTVAPRLTRSALRQTQVYLPPLSAQVEIVTLQHQIQALHTQLNHFAAQLASAPSQYASLKRELAKFAPKDGFDDWIESLPFPLGSILWSYHASATPGIRKQRLLHFFEALAQFLAVIVMSAARRSDLLWSETRLDLQASTHLDRADFGTWISIWANVSKRLRGLGSSSDLVSELLGIAQRDTIDALLSRNLHAPLEAANRLRNDWKGHDFAPTPQIELEQVQQLESLLHEVRARLTDAFVDLRLIGPKHTRGRNGAFRTTVDFLIGSRSPFKESEITLPTFLEEDRLYLWEVDSSDPLPLVPLLRIQPAPAGASSACYFYSRLRQGEVRWVAYHVVDEPESFTRDADVIGLVQELVGGGH